ncbi:MAG TPA: trypsin-like peptidase domain-containing protein [Kofleriaceae bacterium]|nr:trypsin-like peptidase domain-containing protein [Kofleriaceae bacterium]
MSDDATETPAKPAPVSIEQLGVFQIFTGGGTGTGFLISPTVLLTNCHVVAPYRTVGVELRDRQRIVGKVRRIHPRRDLAVVQLDAPLDATVLTVADSDGLQSQQKVSIIGFPVGLPLSLTEGIISSPRQLLAEQHFVQTDAAINPGNSGGPILDGDRRVIAMTTCKLTSADNVGFGIPGTDVRAFADGFAAQTAEFGVVCPSCEALLENANRYCDSCGSDLEDLELESYFGGAEVHPVVGFVEDGLAKAGIDPVLARHGALNWSFYSGSAPIQIWSCCSDHLCFLSALAQPGKQNLGPLFRYLLSSEHVPFAFDMNENTIRLSLTVHATDIFTHGKPEELVERVAAFIAAADRFDDKLIQEYGCVPAPKTRLSFLKEAGK